MYKMVLHLHSCHNIQECKVEGLWHTIGPGVAVLWIVPCIHSYKGLEFFCMHNYRKGHSTLEVAYPLVIEGEAHLIQQTEILNLKSDHNFILL